MITAREFARNLRIDDSSVIRAIQGLCKLSFDDDTHLDYIAQLRGIDHKLEPLPEPRLTKYAFQYLFQDLLAAELKGLPQNPDSVYLNAIIKARRHIENCPWVVAERKETVSIDEQGNVKAPKGSKKIAAKKVYEANKGKNLTRKQWIELLVKEVKLTPLGASTYYANLKSGKY